MSLGSRIVHRGRAALTANLASTPREPLPFLYPSWIRKSSTTGKAESSQDGRLPILSVQPNIPQQSLPPNPVSVSDDETSLQQRFDKPKAEFPDQEPPTTSKKIKAILTGEVDYSKSRGESCTNRHDSQLVERQVKKIRQTEENAKRNELADSRIRNAYHTRRREELRSWLPDWRVILADLIKHTPQHGKWLEEALELVIPLESLPRLLHGIDDYILEIGFQHGVSIRLGEREEGTLQYRRFIVSGPATAISKTTAEVLRIAPTTEMHTTSSLPPPKTEDLALEVSTDKETSLTTLDEEQEVTIRYTLFEPRAKRRRVPPEQLPRPNIWTHVSFLDYVRALTASSVTNHLDRFGFKTKKDHNTAVTEIIRNLFKDPDCKDVISTTACNEAMRYFVKVNRLEDVRVLFVHMEMLKLPMVPETFNIMLRGAAKNEDLHNFHFILHLMLKRGFIPNGNTWIAFMMAHPDVRVKLHILAAMKEKGLTAHPAIMKEVSQQLVQPEIDSSLEQNLSQAQFVAHMDRRYSPDWLTLDSANRVLDGLGARGLISRCWEFLNFMSSRFIEYDNYSINTILHHCKQATNLTGAVELVRTLPTRGDFPFVPDEETYRILFELAWRSRSYNLAKVIWRYACLSAATTHTMRSHVTSSMLYASHKDARATPRERWKQFAGPVIFGSNHHGDHPAQVCAEADYKMNNGVKAASNTTGLGSNDSPDSQSPLVDPGTNESENSNIQTDQSAVPDSKSSEAQDAENAYFALKLRKFNPMGIVDPKESVMQNEMQLWKKTRDQLKLKLLQDLELFKEWRPVEPFSKMLVKALERDTKWRESGDYANMDMQSLIRNAISVPIFMKRGYMFRSKGYISRVEYEWK
jgi:pentatricopeptide repeat protein